MNVDPSHSAPRSRRLIRGVGLGSATALNMIDMIGVGPFITIPLIISAMAGPQGMLGWGLGGLLAMCDGMGWAQFCGSSLPDSRTSTPREHSTSLLAPSI